MVQFYLMGLSQKVYALRKRGKIVCPVGESRAIIVCAGCACADAVLSALGTPLDTTRIGPFFEEKGWRRSNGGNDWECPSCARLTTATRQRSTTS